jgi:hypothetical protein
MEDGDKPYFSQAYLIENFLGLTPADIKANKIAKEKRAKEKEKEGGEEEAPEVTL